MGTAHPDPIPLDDRNAADPEPPAAEKSRYAVPLPSLIADAHVGANEHVHVQPDPPHDWTTGSGGGGDGDAD